MGVLSCFLAHGFICTIGSNDWDHAHARNGDSEVPGATRQFVRDLLRIELPKTRFSAAGQTLFFKKDFVFKKIFRIVKKRFKKKDFYSVIFFSLVFRHFYSPIHSSM